jgi:hypothetical protein
VPPSDLYAVNVTDIATGAFAQVGTVRRQLGGSGSLGVAVTFVARLGKTPTQVEVANYSSVLGSSSACAGTLRAITAALGTATSLGAQAYSAAVPAASIAVANAPFELGGGAPAVVATSAGGGAAATGGAAAGGVIAAVILACAIWVRRSYAKHKKLPCLRDRGAEKRRALEARRLADEANEMISELSTVTPLHYAASSAEPAAAGAAGGAAAPAKGMLLVRAISKRNKALEEEAATRAREAAAARDEAAAARREVAELKALMARQQASAARAEDDRTSFAPTSSD